MSNKLKTSLRSAPSPFRSLSPGQDADDEASVQAEPAKPSAPLYEMVCDGRSEWHNLHDAALFFCTNDSLGIGTRVKDSATGQPRPMTEEERRKIYELSVSLEQH